MTFFTLWAPPSAHSELHLQLTLYLLLILSCLSAVSLSFSNLYQSPSSLSGQVLIILRACLVQTVGAQNTSSCLLVKYLFLLKTDLRLPDALKYFWKIWTCQFKLIGSGNCNHFILSFCWEIKEPNIKHKLLLSGSCKSVQFHSFIKILKVSFLSFRHQTFM